MRTLYTLVMALLCFFFSFGQGGFECEPPTSTASLDANIIRANLAHGGTLFWNGYVAPINEIADIYSLFSGSLWIGGIDPGGNLKIAAQTYGFETGSVDYYPGPLEGVGFVPSQSTCFAFDYHWKITKEQVDAFQADLEDNGILDEEHFDLFIWPGRLNPHFSEVFGTELPDRKLAPFIDTDGDGIYDPENGDYPEVRGDQTIWWVFNDIGNIHAQSQGNSLGYEIQATAFAESSSNPAINNTTFYEYRINSFSLETIDSIYLGLYIDAALGCPDDDYIGCSPENDMAFVYNGDATDGMENCNCPGFTTYCEEPPVLGIKFLHTPQDPIEEEEIGLSGFTYIRNSGHAPTPPAAISDPQNAVDYYRYLTRSWLDDSPRTTGGIGYDTPGEPTSFLFPDNPSDPDGWSMCTVDYPLTDQRFLMSTGPFNLAPGTSTTLSFAVIWKDEIESPCPDMTPLFEMGEEVSDYYFENLVSSDRPVLLQQSAVSFYPNPTDESGQLLLNNANRAIKKISIINTQGQVVQHRDNINANSWEFHRKNLPSGIYYYRLITNDNKLATGKIVLK